MSQTKVFAFLDLEEIPVAWAVMRGMLVSSTHLNQDSSKGFISFMLAGMLKYQNNFRYFNEMIIEDVRATEFTNQSSRLSGMFFFSSKQDAISRIGDENWPPYFSHDNLVELKLYHSQKLTVVDSNWITFAPVTDGLISKSNTEWIRNYWAEKSYNDEPVWEVIGEGIAVIENEKIRRKCYNIIKDYFPKCQIPILMSRIASEVGFNAGLINPFLKMEDNNILNLVYLIDDRGFHDQDVILKIKEHPDTPVLGRLMSENETWQLPDFSPWFQKLSLKRNQFNNNEIKSSTTFHKIEKGN